ncbi:glutaredoxin family protein [Marinicella sp. S1101]|uniref:glutaredoxin family protein n=1 Tax=Marinicella marina TaxID=2996016 RepID=UPI0022608A15|nr:glutaredoxin family protein [Marinicella marina]MCX7555141.1 glutaredoxin family protein [Marinicella marina]MDJ1141418.1 glutaredoxin family protein [Marinicella marina]
MKKLKLYSRIECPLCEYAAEELMAAGIAFTEVDIDTSEELIKAYHIRIPVLSNGDTELNWPFTTDQAQELVNG